MHLFSLCVIATLVPAVLSAQTGTTLAGSVTDVKGSTIAHARVAVHTTSNHKPQSTTTDDAGRFVFALPPGEYELDVDAPGFATTQRLITVAADQPSEIAIPLNVSTVSEQVVVEADASNSLAAQQAPLDTRLDTRSARTEISNHFVENYLSPVADYSETTQLAPGTFNVNANGIGLGDAKSYFRGFPDGNYDITFDGIPFEDTNSPTHHSWAFFPSQWLGGVDFDRSPGSASTIGPTPFGGSINLLSKPLINHFELRGGVSYGSFNTLLIDGSLNAGKFGPGRKMNLVADVHRLTSDGFQTFNRQERNAGSLKFEYKISDTRVLSGFAGVLRLTTNTPNFKGPLRSQIATLGYNYLLNNNPTSASYYRYNFYVVPTDFEYVGYKTDLGHGWYLDTKPYTYSYNNHQNYTNTQTGTINAAACSVQFKGIYACGTDKLNSYRKYGEVTTASQVSRFGIFRTGMWYEWAKTDRFQIPQDPLTGNDSALPNFHEKFNTNSYQPFAEYEWHPNTRLTLTGGFKYARYTQDLQQFADNGKTIGSVDPVTKVPFTVRYSSGAYNSYLPSGDANYRIRDNWSIYGQIATGSIIPPSSVFDQSGQVSVLPKPSFALTMQTGTVLKLRRITFDADYYHVHFGNAYTAIADPTIQSASQFVSSGDSVTQGFEGETNVALLHGLNLYANGTYGVARYVSSTVNGAANLSYNHWLANTPANTEAFGLTYSSRGMDFGIFDKRVGPMWNDSGTFTQVVPILPFSTTNLFLNYSLRHGSHLDGTKFRFGLNNLFDVRNTTGVTPATKGATFTTNANDSLGLTPGRSLSMTVYFGYAPKQ
ncbi:TonB-dependent receptor [Terriglobus sp.]|uniref:TonB-dependent receptor n=1 Tax=Terriglobus sp. TaxID=1889013 RepID=UPI003B0047C5